MEAPMFFPHLRQLLPIFLLTGWVAFGCALPSEDSGDSPAITSTPAERLAEPPRGPFGYSLITSEQGEKLDVEGFVFDEECESCHERHGEEVGGSMHALAHADPLYRRMAELARAEAGEEIYAYCSGCHSPQAVVTGLIPETPGSELPEIATAGILCDVCHQISRLTGPTGPWSQPGNASFELSPDEDRKFGPPEGDDEVSDHLVETREFLKGSEFCASCHSVIHPLNGLRLGNTYEEWKSSVYAEKGIQCQDCHMRSVRDAVKVAETLTPVTVMGKSEPNLDDREIAPHFFTGANANAEELGGSPRQAALAEELLRSAARLEIKLADSGIVGRTLSFEVVVHNVGAGHSLPTSLTELREMWVDLKVLAEDGNVLFQSGGLEPNGEIPEGAMRFGAVAGDAQGKVSHKPWEIAQFLSERLVPPKGSDSERFDVTLPEGWPGRLRIEARLFYRSASPKVVAWLMGDQAFEPKQVDMARAEATLVVGSAGM
jgi:hypothetical protein